MYPLLSNTGLLFVHSKTRQRAWLLLLLSECTCQPLLLRLGKLLLLHLGK